MKNIDFKENRAIVGGAIRWNLMEMDIGGSAELVKEEDATTYYGSLRF